MSLPEEESNFLRFYFLNLKVASKAVRVYFNSVHPPAGLAGELSSISTTLKRLRFVTNQQLNTLYPSPASNVKSEHFDTTLIVCLLRNMPPREAAPVTGLDDLPHPGDTSTGADLARVKWYRNMLAHHEDGKLSPVEYSRYWGDLEGAIGRFGGPSLLKESQSAQHIVLDESFKDMFNMLRNCDKDIQDLHVSQEIHTTMINNLQTTIDNQRTIKEQHENKIQELNVSIQKGESEALTLTTEFSEYKGSIEKCKMTIETCKTEIDKMEVTIKGIQEKVMHKQNQVNGFTQQFFRLECKYGNKFKEIDEQLATCAKNIDDIKKEQHNEDIILDIPWVRTSKFGNPNHGNMLKSVINGMKFLNLLSTATCLDILDEKPEERPSILQNPKNREFLEQQGFYDRHKKKSRSESEAKANRLSRTQSLDASEKRKKFQATKSRNYSPLQTVPEQYEVFDPQKTGAGNYNSYGTSVGTGRSSSIDNYRPSMTSIEASTDSFDSGDSAGYTGRNGSSRSEPYLIHSQQMNIADSGILNTEDSQRSVDEEYVSEFTRDSAIQRKSQVERMMSEDCYNVGDDTDILQSLPFSRTGSLESTLTASGIHKLGTKSSTKKGHDSFDDDVDIYSESYLPDKKNMVQTMHMEFNGN